MRFHRIMASCIGVAAWVCAVVEFGGGTPCSAQPMDVSATAEPDGRYQFLVFWKQDDAATVAAKESVTGFVAGLKDQCVISVVRFGDPAQQHLVKKCSVERAPMPLILAIAPNGAITESIMHPVDRSKLANALVSTATADCLKSMQDGRMPNEPSRVIDEKRGVIFAVNSRRNDLVSDSFHAREPLRGSRNSPPAVALKSKTLPAVRRTVTA